ncbi:MAG: 7-cyano-7-deazaguanine synthase [Planctomycetota bacterium]
MKKPRRAIVCLSGGMDSTSLLLRLLAEGRKVYGLSFNYGQKHRIELTRLKQNVTYFRDNDIEFEHHTVEFPKLGSLFHSALTDSNWTVPTGHYEQENMKQTVVPNRNAIFSAISYGYALSIAVQEDADVDFSLGVHSGDHAIYPDCRPEFYEAIFKAFSIGNWDSEKVHLHLPYLHLDKTAILHDAAASIETLGLDFDTVFRNTCTSYQPTKEGKSHGLTGADVERIIAFHEFGRPDPVQYVAPWDDVVKQALRLEKLHRQDSGIGLDD